MKNRTIKTIVYANEMDMGGFPVRQAFPSRKAEQIDPFLLLHHANLEVDPDVPVMQAGVGPHPHRGFSPVTFIFKGGVHHRDSRGNNSVIYAGGTQWMNAGMGVIHSERPPVNIEELGGRQELLQLWVNTPAAHKMDAPAYQPLTAEATPVIVSEDGRTTIRVVSGELNSVKGPIHSYTSVNTFTVDMKKGGRYYFLLPQHHNAFIYLLDGKLFAAGKEELDAHFTAVLDTDGEGIELEALEDTRFFLGSGEPLNEPVVSHGPFVMNSQTELMEAFRDYQLGKMGVLIEE
ncbi:pirin family protein [Sediminibacterium ginsengisoli]|uniref:Pirin family protein n=1 Tax=Sediminibacterium ginsengisoli TaxID=413434 RepID=A0A1T4M695_9BACT|nr:pirin family protein [Sediminibacterium ginsengisoli]SJZ62503.1 hypothetical protein SAMN04488132_103198 [Sediminibacterium ginsengisoli]